MSGKRARAESGHLRTGGGGQARKISDKMSDHRLQNNKLIFSSAIAYCFIYSSGQISGEMAIWGPWGGGGASALKRAWLIQSSLFFYKQSISLALEHFGFFF